MIYFVAIAVLSLVIILLAVRVMKLHRASKYWQLKYYKLKTDYERMVKYTFKRNRQ